MHNCKWERLTFSVNDSVVGGNDNFIGRNLMISILCFSILSDKLLS